MSTLIDTAVTASYSDGNIAICMESGTELRFPVTENPRLAAGTPAQLNNMNLSRLRRGL